MRIFCAVMEIAHKIQRIEREARSAGVSVKAVCQRAEVAQSTFQRAKRGQVEPRFSTVSRLEAALTQLIAEAEQTRRDQPKARPKSDSEC